MTAVQGNTPMNAPIAQSHSGTSQIPHARLSALHGTTPTSRRIVSRTHTGVGTVPIDPVRFANKGSPLSSPSDSSSSSSSSSESTTGDSSALAPLSNADRVRLSALGNNRDITGASGLLRRLLHTLPIVVRIVWRMVARMGFMSAPARTLSRTDPGTLHAFFHTLVTASTAKMCAVPRVEDAE